MNTEPITVTIDLDEFVAAVLARLDATDSMHWLRQQFEAYRAPDRRQQAWVARAAREREAKRRRQRAKTNEAT